MCCSYLNAKEVNQNCFLSVPLDNDFPLILETDASIECVGAVFSQNGRPIAFYSHRLNNVEKKWASVELEAFAIISAVNHFRQYLLGKCFELLTDQQGVAFIFDRKPRNKVKNAKILRWRMDLAEYNFNIKYRPRKANVVADALSRVGVITKDQGNLIQTIHESMGHPGIKRLTEYIKARDLNIADVEGGVKQCVLNCSLCAEMKPRFSKLKNGLLIHSVRPWQRLSIDFMGPKVDLNGHK